MPRGWPPVLTGSAALHAAGAAAFAVAPGYWPWVVGTLAADHAVMAAAGMQPRSRLLGPNIVRLPAGVRARSEVALTFDDGPDKTATPAVLDILDRHGATASFFCVASRGAGEPALVREIVARGHDVENHTFHHPHAFACYGPRALAAEIGRAQDILAGLSGRRPIFFRAPGGLRSSLLEPVLRTLGLSLVSWTRRGFDGVPADPKRVLARLLRGMSAGDVLVLHDGGRSGGRAALQVLPPLLRAIADRGLRPVSLRRALGPH